MCSDCADCRSVLVFLRAWFFTMCDFWPVFGINSMLEVTNRTLLPIPFVAGFRVAEALVLYTLAFFLLLSLCWLPYRMGFWLRMFWLWAFIMLIWSNMSMVFSRYFIFCSYLHYNQITSIQSDTFNSLPRLYEL